MKKQGASIKARKHRPASLTSWRTEGGEQEVRIFSPRGCYALAIQGSKTFDTRPALRQDSPVTEKDVTGIGLPNEAANSRNRNDSAFLSPEVCPSMAGRAGAAAMRAGASSVVQLPSRSATPIGLGDGGIQTANEAHQMNAITSGASAPLVFQNTTFDIVDHNGDAWLTMRDLVCALYGIVKGGGQTDGPFENAEKSLKRLYARHSDEFTPEMSALVKLPTEGGEQEVRIFSPRGCYALAMFARTKVAKAFRRWVLDVLESIRKTGKYESAPYSVGANDTLTGEQADTLRRLLKESAEARFADGSRQGVFMRQGWSKLKAHFKVGYREIPAHDFTEAVSLLTRHAVSGELPAPAPEAPPAPTLIGRRWLICIDRDGQEHITPVPQDASLLTNEEIIKSIGEPGGLFSLKDLPGIIQAAANRLAA